MKGIPFWVLIVTGYLEGDPFPILISEVCRDSATLDTHKNLKGGMRTTWSLVVSFRLKRFAYVRAEEVGRGGDGKWAIFMSELNIAYILAMSSAKAARPGQYTKGE